MDELYDFLKESDSTMMKGISREEFKQTFGTSKGLDNLYSYLSNETPLLKDIDKETFISTFGSQQSRGIEDNYFDNGVLNNTWIGDWIDDMGRAIARGNRSGDATFDTLRIMSEGSDASNEDIKSYIDAAKNAQSIGQSDEFKAFTDAGGFSTAKGWMEFFKNGLTIVPEVIIESLSSMFGNTTTGSVLVGGAIATATGAGATLAPAALGLASGALETTNKFSQMLMEELNSRGLDFTEENIRSVLEDEEALSEIRSKSLKKGLTIGAVDFLTGKVAGSFGAKLAKAATKTEKLVHVAKGIGIVAAGGAGGEFAGELVSGEPLDATSIGLEAVAEIGSGAFNVFVGAYDAIKDKTKPSYKINGRASDRATILERLKDPEFVKNNEIVVENDRELNDKILNYGKDTTPSTESGTTQSVPPTTATGDTGQVTETPTAQGESQQQGPEQPIVQGPPESNGENVQTTGQEANQGPIPDNTNLDNNPTPETPKVTKEAQDLLNKVDSEGTQQSQAGTSQTTQESQATPVQETNQSNQQNQVQPDNTTTKQRVSKAYDINEENLNEFESVVPSEEYNNTDEQNNTFDKYRRDLSEEIAREKSNIANASTVEEENQAVSNLQKLRQKQKEFDSYKKYLNDKPQVQTLIEDEIENSQKPNYEYQDLFDQDPRLAALQDAKDMLEWVNSDEYKAYLKKQGQTDEQINDDVARGGKKYKKDIDILEKDLQINPTNQQTNANQQPGPVQETVPTPGTGESGVQVLENPVIPIGERQTPVIKVGDKYYRAKKDGTASKSEVKNKDFINEYETELRRRTDGRGPSGETQATGQTSGRAETSQEGKTQQQKTTEEGGDGKGEGVVPPVPPTEAPGSETPKGPNTRKSQLGERIQKGDGVSEQFADRVTDIDVLKQENDVTVAEADAVIEAFGEEAAQDFVLARDQKNAPSDAIRVTIGQRLVKRWADAADRAKTPEERDFFNSKAIEVLDGLMDLANDVGRALQMFRLWRDMGPEGYILYAKKLGEKIKKQAKKQFEKALNDIKKVNDKAVDEATRQIGEDIAKEYAIDKIKLIEVIRASLDKNLAAKMKEAFNLTAEESERLANRITKSFDNIYGRMIKESLKKSLPYKLRKYRNLVDNLVKNKKLTDDAIVSAILKELGINPDLTNEQMDYLREALRPMRDIPEDSAQLKDDGAREAIALIHEMFGSEAQSFIPKTNRDSLGWGLFYASILSGPRTQALNIGANIVKMVLDNMWLSIAEWRANKGNPERLRIAISNWLGIWQGIQKGRIEAKEIFFHGRKKTSFSNKFFESSELERWGKEWNIFNNIKNSKNFWEVALKQTAWMAKFVPRFMESADVIAYWGNYMGRYRQLMTEVKANQGYTGRALTSEVNKIMYGGDITKQEAIDQATKELTDNDGKFKGKVGGGFYDKIDVRRRADEILEQNLVKQFGQEVLWDADRFAKNATFQQDPKGVMGTVVNTIQKYHSHKNKLVAVPARLIVPFTRIVANVTNDQLEYIPFIGLARGQNILSKNELTLEERRIATAKGLASMIVLGLGVAALSMFDPADEDEWKVKIHGSGPQDFNKIIQLKGENWQPNSLQVGNTYFSFKDMPFGLFLTLMGNLFDSERYSKGDPSMSASAIQSLLSSPQVILDASFLSGASAFFETVINSKDLKEGKMVENWEKFFVNQGKVVIPNLFRQVASSFDPTWYQTKGIKEYFYKQYAVPYIQLAGGEVDLQPYFTNLGDPVKFGRDGTFPTLARLSGISRFVNVKKEDEIVYDFLDAKNIYIPGLGYGTTVDGKNLWSEDRETFVKLHRRRGELIKDYVKDNMERFKNMNKKDIEDEIKERVSGNTKESFTTEAKKELGLYSTKGRPKRPTRSTRKRGRD